MSEASTGRVVTLAASLGGVETLVAQPATLTHTQLSAEERAKISISETLVRVSVGIEDVDDLIKDFEQALARIRKSAATHRSTGRPRRQPLSHIESKAWSDVCAPWARRDRARRVASSEFCGSPSFPLSPSSRIFDTRTLSPSPPTSISSRSFGREDYSSPSAGRATRPRLIPR